MSEHLHDQMDGAWKSIGMTVGEDTVETVESEERKSMKKTRRGIKQIPSQFSF
jgi:hypothetical protein